MLIKTKSIVLSTTKFKETSLIVKVFTQELGLQSLLINGVRSKKSKTGIALFQPLTLLETVIYHSDKKTIHRVSEIKCYYPFSQIPFNINKSTIAIFLAEWLNKSLRSYEQDSNLYAFLEKKMIALDSCNEGTENFHIRFIIELTRFLGVLPESVSDFADNLFFQAEAGIKERVAIEDFIKGESPQNINWETRKKIILVLAAYYRYHLGHFSDLKSLNVLHEVLS